MLTSGADLTAEEVARRVGASTADVLAIWRTLGLPGRPGERAFSEADAELVRGILSLQQFRGYEGDELLRVMGGALGRVAEAAVAVYVQTVETTMMDAGASLVERARDNAATASMALQIGGAMGTLFAHHVRAAIDRQRLAQTGVAERTLMRLAVGFVDLVGFTPRARQLPPRQLLEVITGLESRAFELAAEHGGRVVKHIGDEIMFVALDARAACDVALALMHGLADAGGAPHGGLSFGEVLTRHGDYYGPVVNLASRLADEAIPGEVLVDEAVAGAAVGEGVAFEPAGRRLLKGFRDPVPVSSLLAEAS